MHFLFVPFTCAEFPTGQKAHELRSTPRVHNLQHSAFISELLCHKAQICFPWIEELHEINNSAASLTELGMGYRELDNFPVASCLESVLNAWSQVGFCRRQMWTVHINAQFEFLSSCHKRTTCCFSKSHSTTQYDLCCSWEMQCAHDITWLRCLLALKPWVLSCISWLYRQTFG